MRNWSVSLRGEGLIAVLLRGSSLSFAITVAGAGISFIGRILIARLIGVEAYGQYDYALSWLNGPLLILAVLGFDTASLRYVAAYRKQAEWSLLGGFLQHSHRRAFVFSTAIGLVLALVSWILQDALPAGLFLTFLGVSLLLPVNSLLLLVSKGLLALKQVAIGQSVYFMFRPILLIIGVLFAFVILDLPTSAPLTIVLYGISSLSLLCFAYLLLRHFIQTASERVRPEFERKAWNRTGLELMVMAVFAMLVSSKVDVLLLGILRGTTEAGIYGVAVTLVSLINFGLVAVNSVIAPLISELYVQSNLKQLQRLVTHTAFGICAYVLITTLLLLVAGKQILALFGSEFTIAFVPLIILMGGKIANSAAGSVGFLLTMTGHQKDAMHIFAIGGLVSVSLNLLLIPRYHMIGAAIASTVATAVWNLLMYVRVRKQTGIDPTVFSAIRARS